MADCMEKDWSFTGSDGVHTLYATIWEPSEGEPRAVIQICHGMMEHIRRYDRFARALCDRGFVVCGDDHLGHGRTAEQPEDLGYFGETDGWKHMAEDELLLRREMQRRYPDKPYFLLGHSMGSFITRRVIALDGEGLAGYICCGTAGRNPLTKLGIGLAGIVTALRGPKRTGRFLNAMAFQNYNRRFPEDDNELAWLSRRVGGSQVSFRVYQRGLPGSLPPARQRHRPQVERPGAQGSAHRPVFRRDGSGGQLRQGPAAGVRLAESLRRAGSLPQALP